MKISNLQKAKNKFNEMFHMDISNYYDPALTYIYNKIIIDIVKFADDYEEKYGKLTEGVSLKDSIFEHFGQDGVSLICDLLGIDVNNID